MNTVLISLAVVGITGIFLEKLLIILGKIDLAQIVGVATLCVGSVEVLLLISKLLKALKGLG